MNRKESDHWRRKHPQGIQSDRGKPKTVKRSKKPRKKPEPTGLAGMKIGRNVLMRDNENVKPGGKE